MAKSLKLWSIRNSKFEPQIQTRLKTKLWSEIFKKSYRNIRFLQRITQTSFFSTFDNNFRLRYFLTTKPSRLVSWSDLSARLVAVGLVFIFNAKINNWWKISNTWALS